MPDLVALALPAAGLAAALEGTWAAGDAVLPVPPDLPAPERRRLLDALRPARVVTTDGDRRCHGGVPVAEGTALVVATSGSTGVAKGVELSHRALSAANDACLERIGARRGQRWLCCLPLHHIAGLQVVLRSRALGREPLVVEPFDTAAVAQALRAGDVDHLSLVPTQLRRLLDAGADLSGLSTVLLGGAAAAPDLVARARRHGVPLVVTYGMTETCGGCVYDGRPLADVEVSVDEEGLIRLAGPMLFDGYRLRPDLSAAALEGGALRTADLGRIEPDGRLTVLGRVDDVIVTGGRKVAAGEIADLLASHPEVADVAVFPRDDPEWGQRVVAAVVARDASAPPSLASLRAHVAARAAGWKAPRELRIIDALPRTALGKVDHGALRARSW